MRDDKPPPIVRLILGEIAELSAGLRRLGLPPEAVERLIDAYVERRLGGGGRAESDVATNRTRHERS